MKFKPGFCSRVPTGTAMAPIFCKAYKTKINSALLEMNMTTRSPACMPKPAKPDAMRLIS